MGRQAVARRAVVMRPRRTGESRVHGAARLVVEKLARAVRPPTVRREAIQIDEVAARPVGGKMPQSNA